MFQRSGTPGQWLPVEDLSRSFQVSRQPVMEAMRRLSGEWLVEIVPQVGCRVAEYDRQAFLDFLAIFGDMEARMAALAAERRTPDQMATMSNVLEQMSRPGLSEESDRSLSREFHSTIMEMSHSPVLARLCEQMWDFGDYVSMVIAGPRAHSEVLQREQFDALWRVVETVRIGNPGLARLHWNVWLTYMAPPSGDVRGPDAQDSGDPAMESQRTGRAGVSPGIARLRCRGEEVGRFLKTRLTGIGLPGERGAHRPAHHHRRKPAPARPPRRPRPHQVAGRCTRNDKSHGGGRWRSAFPRWRSREARRQAS